MDKKRFVEEAKMMLKLNHPNVVRCFQVCTREHLGKEEVCIITELMATSLDKFLRGNIDDHIYDIHKNKIGNYRVR